MDVAAYNALKEPVSTIVHLFELTLPSKTIRLVDGSGFALWNGNSFIAEDADYGALDYIDAISESEGTEAPRINVFFKASDNGALAGLTAPQAQGSPCYVWLAVLNTLNNAIIGEPDLLFAGELDSGSVNFDKNSSILKMEMASAWEYLFDNNEGQRWNDSFHRGYLWGGASNQRGFEHVTNVQRKNYWGYTAPRSSGGKNYTGGSEGRSGRPPGER